LEGEMEVTLTDRFFGVAFEQDLELFKVFFFLGFFWSKGFVVVCVEEVEEEDEGEEAEEVEEEEEGREEKEEELE